MASSKVLDRYCSIARSLGVLGERWTFLILREAMDGVTRFAQFRDALGIAPDVLTDRLTTLVDYGVMTRAPYQEPGSRSRYAYTLTPAGEELHVALGLYSNGATPTFPALMDRPSSEGHARPTVRCTSGSSTIAAVRSPPTRWRRFAPPPTPPTPDERSFRSAGW